MRWKGIVGFFVVNVLLSVVGFFFVEGLIKGGVEFVGSRLNGAKVEIEEVEVSFLDLFLNIKQLQVADPDDEWRNRFVIKDIRFKLDLDPLLEKKFVIEEMAIEGIVTGTEREESGKLVRAKERSLWTKGTRLINEEVQALPGFQMLKGEQKVNVDELVKPAQVTAPGEIKKISTELDTRHKNSRLALENLNVASRVEALKKEMDSLNLKEKDPLKLQQELKNIGRIKKDMDALVNDVKQTKQRLQDDFKFVDNSIEQVEQVKERDYQAIVKTITDVKGMDEGNIARLVFGPVWFDRGETLLGWLDMGRKVMPPKGEEVVEDEFTRIVGVNVEFPEENSYPGFLLKTASISVGQSDEAAGLKFEGKVEGISSDPALYGKPTVISLKGTKPEFEFDGTLDHTGAVSRDSYKLTMRNVKLKDFSLVKSPLLPKKISRGRVDISVNLLSEDEEVELILEVLPREIVFDEEDIPEGVLAKEIARILATAKDIKIKGRMAGRKGDLKLKIDSNIDKILVERFKGLIDERMAEAKQQIRQRIEQMVLGPKTELLKEYEVKQGELNSLLQDKQALVNQVQSKANELENAIKARIEEEANKAKRELEKKAKKRLENKLKDMLKRD